jgi:hypothetical protein
MTGQPLNARVVGALMITMAACSGCAFAAASVAPSAVSAGPVVVDHLGADRGDSYWVARYDDVVQAALRAGERLSLDLKEQDIDENRAKLRFGDSQGAEIRLLIERPTDTVTRMRFEVRSSGSLGFASLLGRQIVDELNDADAFLVDWSAKEDAAPNRL